MRLIKHGVGPSLFSPGCTNAITKKGFYFWTHLNKQVAYYLPLGLCFTELDIDCSYVLLPHPVLYMSSSSLLLEFGNS